MFELEAANRNIVNSTFLVEDTVTLIKKIRETLGKNESLDKVLEALRRSSEPLKVVSSLLATLLLDYQQNKLQKEVCSRCKRKRRSEEKPETGTVDIEVGSVRGRDGTTGSGGIHPQDMCSIQITETDPLRSDGEVEVKQESLDSDTFNFDNVNVTHRDQDTYEEMDDSKDSKAFVSDMLHQSEAPEDTVSDNSFHNNTDEMIDPITKIPIVDPVYCKVSGEVHERSVLEYYCDENGVDPVTGQEMSRADIVQLSSNNLSSTEAQNGTTSEEGFCNLSSSSHEGFFNGSSQVNRTSNVDILAQRFQEQYMDLFRNNPMIFSYIQTGQCPLETSKPRSVQINEYKKLRRGVEQVMLDFVLENGPDPREEKQLGFAIFNVMLRGLGAKYPKVFGSAVKVPPDLKGGIGHIATFTKNIHAKYLRVFLPFRPPGERPARKQRSRKRKQQHQNGGATATEQRKPRQKKIRVDIENSKGIPPSSSSEIIQNGSFLSDSCSSSVSNRTSNVDILGQRFQEQYMDLFKTNPMIYSYMQTGQCPMETSKPRDIQINDYRKLRRGVEQLMLEFVLEHGPDPLKDKQLGYPIFHVMLRGLGFQYPKVFGSNVKVPPELEGGVGHISAFTKNIHAKYLRAFIRLRPPGQPIHPPRRGRQRKRKVKDFVMETKDEDENTDHRSVHADAVKNDTEEADILSADTLSADNDQQADNACDDPLETENQ